jgi:hypothetical protein
MRITILFLLLTGSMAGYCQAPKGVFKYGTELSSSDRKVDSVKKDGKDILVYYTRTSVEKVTEHYCVYRCVVTLHGTEKHSSQKVEYTESIADMTCTEIVEPGMISIAPKPGSAVTLSLRNGGLLPHDFSKPSDAIITWTDVRAYRYRNGKRLNNLIGKYRKLWIYLGAHYTPSFAYRKVRINSAQLNTSEQLNQREANEYNVYGYACGIQAGVTFKQKHTLFIEYLRLTQGFEAMGQTIDWHTGNPSVSATDRQYIFKSDGVGIGYSFSKYDHIINFAFETGLYHTFLAGGNQLDTLSTKEQLINVGIRERHWGGKLGAGLSFRPRYGTEFRLMPVVYYNFTSHNKGSFRTGLYNVGLNISACFRIDTGVK